MTIADRALAWLKTQWIAPDVSVFLHEAIAAYPYPTDPMTGAEFLEAMEGVIEPRSDEELKEMIADIQGDPQCPTCGQAIEDSREPAVDTDGSLGADPDAGEQIGVLPSPSPDFPPAAVERRDEVPQRRAIDMCTCGHPRDRHGAHGCLVSIIPGETECQCPRWTPAPQPAGKHLTIELPDKTVVDVSKLDGSK